MYLFDSQYFQRNTKLVLNKYYMKNLNPYYKLLTETRSLLPRVTQSYFPTDIRKIYQFPDNLNGAGQRVAIIQLGGGFRQNDLDVYFSSLGLNSPIVQFVSINGAPNNPTDNNSDDVEVMLDLCIAVGVANGITPIIYMAPNSFQGFIDAINRAVSDRVDIISISWGAPEKYWPLARRNSMHNALMNAANNGITVCVASGDDGSSNGASGLNVDFPAGSPAVLSCGGTRCHTLSNIITSEVVWNDIYGSSGGGFSSSFGRPSYQPFTFTKSTRRAVPDIAGAASPNTGYKIRSNGEILIVGGTSAVSPLWSGIIACANQAANKKMGYVNPKIYSILNLPSNQRPLRDITSGNNGAYSAKSGWDACTGLGTPNVTKLINYLKTK